MKIALLVDSGADICAKEAKELNINVIRMPLIIDEVEYIEEDGIKIEDFIDMMRKGAMCKTSMPSIGSLIEKYEELLKEHDHVIYVPLSSKLSGTYNGAVQAAKEFVGKVTVIDSLHIACITVTLMLEIRKLIEQGLSPEEIKNKVEQEATMWACILPDDLMYLKRGGRISPMAAALGNLLKIVPILKVEDGAIDVYDKVRTRKKAVQVSIDAVTANRNYDGYYWFVLHADCLEEAHLVASDLKDVVNQDVIVKPLRSILMAHTGPNTIGVGYMKKLV